MNNRTLVSNTLALIVIAIGALIWLPSTSSAQGGAPVICHTCEDIGPCMTFANLIDVTSPCRVIDYPPPGECEERDRYRYECLDYDKGAGDRFPLTGTGIACNAGDVECW